MRPTAAPDAPRHECICGKRPLEENWANHLLSSGTHGDPDRVWFVKVDAPRPPLDLDVLDADAAEAQGQNEWRPADPTTIRSLVAVARCAMDVDQSWATDRDDDGAEVLWMPEAPSALDDLRAALKDAGL